ncbi:MULTISPECIES: peptide antibiotic transporter SbmA [Grimontia]|uniref:Peptide antibiotic transporter SbmA n=1 Tax=Grimontia marina TaxID=646534 RepID=A0A128FBP0_9GAMM|nr:MULTISPECIES: peptide antibiotic transporter SbmA [Grimontia]WRW00011.1 peptide antibiotic transporter SbmA [Grimontia sp. NTOU-MAR1]CZF84219.1 Peptide antibiotic transporter SbmA [Grimontia marina]
MFKSFFLNRRWFHWSILGSVLILSVTWYKVQLDVRINEWFGTFYNLIQEALSEPNSVPFEQFQDSCIDFLYIALIYIVVAVLLEFFIRHYVFRWRTAMNDYYVSHWGKIRHIEGASQRIQEDTMRFARIVESLGVSFMRSIMTLFAFLPILWVLSENVTELPWIGEVAHSLVYLAILSALFGTVLLAVVGIKLPGLEFNNQKVEAAYRKELVFGEDHAERAEPESLRELFSNVRRNYFNLYRHYLYFDIAKWSYLQGAVIVPYIALGPTIVSGAVTLGVLQQIIRAFGKVEDSFQFLVNSWSTIVELMSIYKRLKGFEEQIDLAIEAEKSAATG